MWTLIMAMVVGGVTAGGIKLHLSDEMKSMLEKSNWDHQNTALSFHGPITLDVHSSFKLKKGQLFLKSWVHRRHKDCAHIKKHRPLSRDGVYTIYPAPGMNKRVFCDMSTDGGGWTVIQKRIDGDTNFFRNWKEYKNGFGHAEDEYWLGNDAIHALTKDKKQILRIDLMKFSMEKAHATYSSFFVDSETNKYKLVLGNFKGTKGLGDSFNHSNNSYFTTKGADNDNFKRNCADIFKAGWWFSACTYLNLNGVYRNASRKDGTELSWYHWGDSWRSLKSAKMMIRPSQIV